MTTNTDINNYKIQINKILSYYSLIQQSNLSLTKTKNTQIINELTIPSFKLKITLKKELIKYIITECNKNELFEIIIVCKVLKLNTNLLEFWFNNYEKREKSLIEVCLDKLKKEVIFNKFKFKFLSFIKLIIQDTDGDKKEDSELFIRDVIKILKESGKTNELIKFLSLSLNSNSTNSCLEDLFFAKVKIGKFTIPSTSIDKQELLIASLVKTIKERECLKDLLSLLENSDLKSKLLVLKSCEKEKWFLFMYCFYFGLKDYYLSCFYMYKLMETIDKNKVISEKRVELLTLIVSLLEQSEDKKYVLTSNGLIYLDELKLELVKRRVLVKYFKSGNEFVDDGLVNRLMNEEISEDCDLVRICLENSWEQNAIDLIDYNDQIKK